MAKPKLDQYNVENSAYDNTGSGLTATDMQAAIDELVTVIAAYMLKTGDPSLTSAFEIIQSGNVNRFDLNSATPNVELEAGVSGADKCTVVFKGTSIDFSFDGGAIEYKIKKGGAVENEDLIKKVDLDTTTQYMVQSDVTGVTGADPITNMMSLTQAEYDAIGSPDPNTFYLITDAASNYEYLGIACSDLTSNLTVGTTKAYFRCPFGATINKITASVIDAPTGANLIIDVNDSGSTIYSTRLVIDAGTKTSVGSATTPVFIDTSIAEDAEITIDIDQVGSTNPGKGLIVYFELLKN